MKRIAFDKENGEHISDLMSEAQSVEIRSDHVFFDSWFSSTKVIRFMRENALDVVTMVKKSSRSITRFREKCCPVRTSMPVVKRAVAVPGVY